MKLKLREALGSYNASHPEAMLTQAALAERIGTTQSLVNKHLRGRVLPGPRMLSRYAQALDCSIDDLFSEVSDMRGVA